MAWDVSHKARSKREKEAAHAAQCMRRAWFMVRPRFLLRAGIGDTSLEVNSSGIPCVCASEIQLRDVLDAPSWSVWSEIWFLVTTYLSWYSEEA
ncbi:DNA-directed RNA polymerase IV subunit 1 [Dorcoceras hygrometricum]|uniref:DNA-directed RNA polymerase IV subunit 1 n=1 Tax=Dorcoceras hygrometricum TaxID=472368 RepID=A0A2Z7D434_9LAMI|nr:DNA-directed RNA polymerase IV subunit 1 [Dorcoceras hygrometricum]